MSIEDIIFADMLRKAKKKYNMKVNIEDYETRHGLLYHKGETDDHKYISIWRGDILARSLGFMYVEQLVDFIEEKNKK